jgi:hypothetical protein
LVCGIIPLNLGQGCPKLEDMKMKIALFSYISNRTHDLERGIVAKEDSYEDRNPDTYVRISEWMEIDFKPRESEQIMKDQLNGIDLERERVMKKASEELESLSELRNSILAITFQE